MKAHAAAFAALGLAVTLAGAAEAQTRRVQAGTLRCEVEGGVGLILGSRKEMACRFTPGGGGRDEFYSGTVSRLGLDIGVTGQAVIVWLVFAPTSSLRRGALAGTYAGVSAEASAGVGLGARALIGGNNSTIGLQPLSVQAQTGVNIAAGISGMTLRSASR